MSLARIQFAYQAFMVLAVAIYPFAAIYVFRRSRWSASQWAGYSVFALGLSFGTILGMSVAPDYRELMYLFALCAFVGGAAALRQASILFSHQETKD